MPLPLPLRLLDPFPAVARAVAAVTATSSSTVVQARLGRPAAHNAEIPEEPSFDHRFAPACSTPGDGLESLRQSLGFNLFSADWYPLKTTKTKRQREFR